MDPLIPGLIDDLGRECLIRVPHHEFPTAIAVCKSWRAEITSPAFRRWPKVAGLARPIIVLAQARPDSPDESDHPGNGMKHHTMGPAYQLAQFDRGTGSWVSLPPVPGLPEGLPMFCGLVGCGTDLLVIGGWDPATCRASGSVYVYSFLSGNWRRGADMPGVPRSFFGCGSDGDRTVVVAGGHDEEKNALRSALMYDVAEDRWVPLPDLARERDECRVVFHRGAFHAVSGYPTEAQGCFERTAEALDPATWRWGPVVEDFLEASAGPGLCVAGPDGRTLYAFIGRRSSDVAVQQGGRWHVVAKVPADVSSSQWVATCGENLVVIGSSKFGEPHNGYMLDLKSYKWSKIDVPREYSGHVQSGCVLEL